MDHALLTAALEAQFLMGHRVPSPTIATDGRTITTWSWDEDQVRQALAVPEDDVWGQRILELEFAGLASFCLYAAPVSLDEDGIEHEIPGWRDEPREEWGELSITARGVLRLAEWYGRPYVRLEESPALLAHWTRVQEASERRLHAYREARGRRDRED